MTRDGAIVTEFTKIGNNQSKKIKIILVVENL